MLYFNKIDPLFYDPSLVYFIAGRTRIELSEYFAWEKIMEPSYNIYSIHYVARSF